MTSHISPRLNILILGDHQVGKTNLLKRYVDDKFDESYSKTQHCELKCKTLSLAGNIIQVYFDDTIPIQVSAQDFRRADGIIIAYDCNNPEGLEQCENWFVETCRYTRNPGLLLIGNKCDLSSKDASFDNGKELASKYGASFAVTSAKDGTNVEWVFASLIYDILGRICHA